MLLLSSFVGRAERLHHDDDGCSGDRPAGWRWRTWNRRSAAVEPRLGRCWVCSGSGWETRAGRAFTAETPAGQLGIGVRLERCFVKQQTGNVERLLKLLFDICCCWRGKLDFDAFFHRRVLFIPGSCSRHLDGEPAGVVGDDLVPGWSTARWCPGSVGLPIRPGDGRHRVRRRRGGHRRRGGATGGNGRLLGPPPPPGRLVNGAGSVGPWWVTRGPVRGRGCSDSTLNEFFGGCVGTSPGRRASRPGPRGRWSYGTRGALATMT